MVSWSARRKTIYLLSAILFLAFLGFLIFFVFFYTPPSCFDNVQNQGELGVDCGGGCDKLCVFQVSEPIISWTRFFEVFPGNYNLISLVRNPNFESEALNASYVFKIFDESGILIKEVSGSTFIPSSRIFAVFAPNVSIDGKKIGRVAFEFKDGIEWYKNVVQEPSILTLGAKLTREETQPRIEATVSNNSLLQLFDVEFVALVYNNENNPVGTSRTVLDVLNKDENRNIVFTWPKPFDAGVRMCENPVDVNIVFDRSGSMVFGNWNLLNPEPMNSAKTAAIAFLDNMTQNSRIGIITFATDASVDYPLAGSINDARSVAENIRIRANTNNEVWLEQTNITEGLELALDEFNQRGLIDNKKFIVLFTDGVPTHPKSDSNPRYAFDRTLQIAQEIKDKNIDIYIVGLGEEQIDEKFLLEVSSGQDYYFSTDNVSNLVSIFEEIATDICKKAPAVIEILPKVQNRSFKSLF